MAEKKFTTRIQLKYDTYANWVANNPVLKAGEVAIATVPSNQDGVQNAPSVLIKVGDGTSDYKTLKFVSALAADVHEWAKAADKPEYSASEISGIDAYIAEYVNEQMGISVDTDTQYKLVKVSDTEYKLQSKGKTDSAWADVDCDHIVIPQTYDDTALAGRVTDVEEAVEVLNGTGAGSVSKAIADAIAALNLANTYAPKTHGHAMSEVDGLEDALAGKQAAGDYATKAEAQGYADAKDEAIAAAKKAGDDAQADVDALEERVATNEGAIEKLNGASTVEGSVDYKIAQAVAAIMENPDETMNSINELVTWINDHAADALALSNQVTENKNDIAALEALVGTTGVAQQITDAINAALKIDGVDKYALASDLTAAIARIAALETEIAKKANDADLAAIAKTGNVNDLVQTDGDVLIFECGDSNI